MDFYMKLPRNKKEFPLFLAVISVISVNIIAPLITCLEMGFSLNSYKAALANMPFLLLFVILLVLLTEKPADKLTHMIVSEGDSFRSVITINILCNVFLMSIFLTIIGTWIGMRQISLIPLFSFPNNWPRNFAISFFVEALIAQPIARFVMLKYHQAKDKQNTAA